MKCVFLVGFMGAGKTTVARLLSARLAVPWIDLDVLIAEKAGKTIQGIFAEDGEETFRNLESEMLTALAAGPPLVVATGGGVVGRPENWGAMRQLGCVVYLKTGWETLRMRLDGATDRPLVSRAQSWAEVRNLYERRIPLYEQSDLTVETDARDAAQVAAEIVNLIEDRQSC